MKIYSWGSGNLGQLGIDNTDDSVSKPTLMLLPINYSNEDGEYENVKDIVGGGCHTMMIVDDDDDLYTFGSNDSGQLGINRNQQQQVPFETRATLVNYFKSNSIKIKNCSAGWGHSLACDEKGNVYSWGSNTHSQLGIIDKHIPEHITTATTTTTASTTSNISPPINNNNTELVNKPKKRIVFKKKKPERKKLYEPKLIEFFSINNIKIISVSCGMRHSIALSSEYNVYGWGCNKFGQLSNINSNDNNISNKDVDDNSSQIQELPILIEFKDQQQGQQQQQQQQDNIKIIQISCGFQHTALLDINLNRVLTFGQNKFGQLGNGNCIDQINPTFININSIIDDSNDNDDENIKEIQCGWSNTCILTNKGRLFICGRGEYGTLGNGKNKNELSNNKFKLLSNFNYKIKNFSIGSEHILLQNELNDIYSFGWNEHYQLGLCEPVIIGIDGDNQSIPKLLPSIKGNNNSLVKAGSGHSFLILPNK